MDSQYNKHLFKDATQKAFASARALRQVCTEAEELLWKELRNRKLERLKFRRQHPLSSFVADFYCNELQLVIEVDGAVHDTETARQYDEERTRVLQDHGISVMRFTNDEVKMNMPSVLKRVADYAHTKRHAKP